MKLTSLHSLKTKKYDHLIGEVSGFDSTKRVIVKLHDRLLKIKEENLTDFELNRATLCYGSVLPNEVSKTIVENTLIKPRAISQCVVSFLMIPLGQQKDCRILECSGSAAPQPSFSIYDFSPKSALEPGTNSCWISNYVGPTPFRAWMNFGFPVVVRIESFAVRIPVLPNGPLSVRKFFLESSMDGENFKNTSPSDGSQFITHDVSVLQQFVISPPIEAQCVRMVCTEAADFNQAQVGFWEIQFNTAE